MDLWRTCERRKPGGPSRGRLPSSLCSGCFFILLFQLKVNRSLTAEPLTPSSPHASLHLPDERFSDGVSVIESDVTTCYPGQPLERATAHHGDVRNRQRVGKRALPAYQTAVAGQEFERVARRFPRKGTEKRDRKGTEKGQKRDRKGTGNILRFDLPSPLLRRTLPSGQKRDR